MNFFFSCFVVGSPPLREREVSYLFFSKASHVMTCSGHDFRVFPFPLRGSLSFYAVSLSPLPKDPPFSLRNDTLPRSPGIQLNSLTFLRESFPLWAFLQVGRPPPSKNATLSSSGQPRRSISFLDSFLSKRCFFPRTFFFFPTTTPPWVPLVPQRPPSPPLVSYVSLAFFFHATRSLTTRIALRHFPRHMHPE